MIELKFRDQLNRESARDTSAKCSCTAPVPIDDTGPAPCCLTLPEITGTWIQGTLMTEAGPVPVVSTDLARADYIEHIRCRVSAFRQSYTVLPGLYAVGAPDKDSDVFVSANYKLSFDALRKELKQINGWVLVLDTKGINVWCAAGKGTLGTDELARRISVTRLATVVKHRRLIVPQLGAPGISAPRVRKETGFQVKYGPVRAHDIPAYIESGYKATRQMRTVSFPVIDRLVLTPMEILPALKYYVWFALIVLIVFGLHPSGILFDDALKGGLPFLLFGLMSVFAGAFLTPVLLPLIPFRSFALKGWIAGMLCLYPAVQYTTWRGNDSHVLLACAYLFFPVASSYIALQFTGSTTFTGMSGVKKELRISLPVSISAALVSLILLAVYKLMQWRTI